MLAVARAVEQWDPDPQRGRFRHWLFRIARNLIINHLTRRKHQTWGTGQSAAQVLLEEQCGREDSITHLFEIEYRRSMFQCAAKQVQTDVLAKTWQAFWLSAIEDLPIADVAQRLGMSAGSVYIARNRVVARLRAEVRKIENADLDG
jgi:RNA polymerase sigma-70 factor (ECF subfamily)